MKAELNIENPGDLNATIAFTFTLKQWVDVQKALAQAPHYGPTGEIRKAIDQLATDACRTFRFSPEEDEG